MGCRQSRSAMMVESDFQPNRRGTNQPNRHRIEFLLSDSTSAPTTNQGVDTLSPLQRSFAPQRSEGFTDITEPTVAVARSRRRQQREVALRREEERMAEILALQQSLRAMEDFFQSLLGQAHFLSEAMDPSAVAASLGPPPASGEFIRSLPVVKPTPGMTCAVCGEAVNETDTLTELPCGHVFHSKGCIEPWLERHCTCPVCRFEAPTDDSEYETGRLERMSHRRLPESRESTAKEDSEERTEPDAVSATAPKANSESTNDPTSNSAAFATRTSSGSIVEEAISSPRDVAYDADESEREEQLEEEDEAPAAFPNNRTSAQATHYDADSSSLETVDIGGRITSPSRNMTSATTAATGTTSSGGTTAIERAPRLSAQTTRDFTSLSRATIEANQVLTEE